MQKGIQKKNKISSIGRLNSLMPKVYLLLKPQTPLAVNTASQIKKQNAEIILALKNAPKYLLNFIFG